MLDKLDLTRVIPKEAYESKLLKWQLQLREMAFELYRRKRSCVVVYEGWDAAGKGGNIRRLTAKLDPRGFQVHSIAKPEGDDAMHHYLWRFMRRLRAPVDRQITIFDRSWYGRVLVERVEGFAREDEWRRAYSEINEFERHLAGAGIVLIKFWIHISFDEQKRRFEDRRKTPHKHWKLTEEDWRNREKWEEYRAAVNDMLLKTSTRTVPWTLIAGNNKNYARVRTVRHAARTIENALKD
jgi:polyphosphate kinase 2 (PPK2 family)